MTSVKPTVRAFIDFAKAKGSEAVRKADRNNSGQVSSNSELKRLNELAPEMGDNFENYKKAHDVSDGRVSVEAFTKDFGSYVGGRADKAADALELEAPGVIDDTEGFRAKLPADLRDNFDAYLASLGGEEGPAKPPVKLDVALPPGRTAEEVVTYGRKALVQYIESSLFGPESQFGRDFPHLKEPFLQAARKWVPTEQPYGSGGTTHYESVLEDWHFAVSFGKGRKTATAVLLDDMG